MHELIRLERTPRAGARPLRGGLPMWQQKRVAEYIEEHLAEEISLAALGTSRVEPLSFCPRLQAILRRASASLPYGPADGDIVGGAGPERLSHFTRECEAGDMVRASAFPINVKNRALSNPCEGVSIVE